jgi:hypothetical protein
LSRICCNGALLRDSPRATIFRRVALTGTSCDSRLHQWVGIFKELIMAFSRVSFFFVFCFPFNDVRWCDFVFVVIVMLIAIVVLHSVILALLLKLVLGTLQEVWKSDATSLRLQCNRSKDGS